MPRAGHESEPTRWMALAVFVATVVVFVTLAVSVAINQGPAADDPDLLGHIARSPDRWYRFAQSISRLGSVPVLVVVASTASAILWLLGAWLVEAVVPIVSFLVGALLVALTKGIVDRASPGQSGRLLGDAGISFPAGHAGGSAAVYVSIAIVVAALFVAGLAGRVAVLFAAGTISVAVGMARLVTAVHWPTDVLAGWALGTAVAIAVSSAGLAAGRSVRADGPHDWGPGGVLRAVASIHRPSRGGPPPG